jgi:hypothetical protein
MNQKSIENTTKLGTAEAQKITYRKLAGNKEKQIDRRRRRRWCSQRLMTGAEVRLYLSVERGELGFV